MIAAAHEPEPEPAELVAGSDEGRVALAVHCTVTHCGHSWAGYIDDRYAYASRGRDVYRQLVDEGHSLPEVFGAVFYVAIDGQPTVLAELLDGAVTIIAEV